MRSSGTRRGGHGRGNVEPSEARAAEAHPHHHQPPHQHRSGRARPRGFPPKPPRALAAAAFGLGRGMIEGGAWAPVALPHTVPVPCDDVPSAPHWLGRNVYVRRLPPVSPVEMPGEAHVFNLFSRFGRIERLRVLRDHATHLPLGAALVLFVDPRDAAAAVQFVNGGGVPGASASFWLPRHLLAAAPGMLMESTFVGVGASEGGAERVPSPEGAGAGPASPEGAGAGPASPEGAGAGPASRARKGEVKGEPRSGKEAVPGGASHEGGAAGGEAGQSAAFGASLPLRGSPFTSPLRAPAPGPC